ncbi:unnamed protein product [Ceutorhynchus assimilis]|uniref:Odorant receptor n=1 Tax=Ceutorhynchus assimilis TaxID=467358 RepID=A0A9N9QN44_9CUCU|nr:unnamed protein product [Ceutorhynchus assimilis]
MEVHILRFARNLMILVGVWQDDFSCTTKQKIYHIFSYIIHGLFSTVCFMILMELPNLLGNVRKLLDDSFFVSVAVLTSVKIAIFRSRKFQHLINQVIGEEQDMRTDLDEDEHMIYLKYANYVYKLSTAVLVGVASTTLYLIIKPIIQGMINPDVEKPMIVIARVPFDQDQHYRASLMVQSMYFTVGSVYYCTTQIFYISITTFVKSQLKILQYRFRNFDAYRKRFDSSMTDEDVIKKLIRYHIVIMRFAKELNDAIKYMLLMEYVLISITIATVTFRLILVEGANELVLSISCSAVLIAQLFILGSHADDISIESVAVADAVYEMNWYEKSLQVQDMALIVIMRSQKPLSLTIGPFATLTTGTIIPVINAAYSYITIMRRIIQRLDEL